MVNEIWQGDVLELAKKLPDNSIHCIVTSPPYWSLRDYGTATWVGGSGECDHLEKSGQRRDVGRANINGFHGSSKESILKEKPYKNTCPKCGATRIDQQLGLEKTPEEYIEKMVLIFRELRRALREDGTLWMNLGDSYVSSPTGNPGNSYTVSKKTIMGAYSATKNRTIPPNLKPKDLCGIPWRVALALQADGWYLRSDIIWSKPNPMPESVTDRPTKAHEYVFLLTKSSRYFYDAEAIREAQSPTSAGNRNEFRGGGTYTNGNSFNNTNHKSNKTPGNDYDLSTGRNRRTVWEIAQNSVNAFLEWLATQDEVEDLFSRFNSEMANKKDIWEIATQPYPEAHFATYPEALVEPCILAGTSAYGVCGECGKPWERIIEKKSALAADGKTCLRCGKNHGKPKSQIKHTDHMAGNYDVERFVCNDIQTTGWQPTCNHTEQPIPAIVLDPFMGSGTTASVAKRLGRSFLGFELNPDYIKLAWKRIDETQPPLILENDITVVAQYVAKQLSF